MIENIEEKRVVYSEQHKFDWQLIAKDIINNNGINSSVNGDYSFKKIILCP